MKNKIACFIWKKLYWLGWDPSQNDMKMFQFYENVTGYS